MTVLLTYAWGVGVAGATGVIALALLAVPVAEVACAIVRRRRSGRSILAGDRAHPYDLLVAADGPAPRPARPTSPSRWSSWWSPSW